MQGHEVTVATTALPERSNKSINGVAVEEFDISGNAVRRFRGETDRYQQFLIDGDFDLMMNYAAQQWTMDLVFPILDRIPYRKVMIPCGFSGLFDSAYDDYFAMMPAIMLGYDHIIFHADDYRDTNFARENNISNFTIIPNGASEVEFGRSDSNFRKQYNISKDVPLLLTIGSHTAAKGHRLCMDAFTQLDVERAVLVVIGNIPDGQSNRKAFADLLLDDLRGLHGAQALKRLLRALLGGVAPGCLPDDRIRSRWISMMKLGKKRVLLLDPLRKDVVAALKAADLFLFGSNIEYSPLVLYEAIASATPFVSLACGNAAEIASWSGGGVIAPTIQKEHGYVDGDPGSFAETVNQLLADDERRKSMAITGFRAWQEKFSWEKIATQYEALYLDLVR